MVANMHENAAVTLGKLASFDGCLSNVFLLLYGLSNIFLLLYGLSNVFLLLYGLRPQHSFARRTPSGTQSVCYSTLWQQAGFQAFASCLTTVFLLL
jgi:hypothetical protein